MVTIQSLQKSKCLLPKEFDQNQRVFNDLVKTFVFN
jgi:hypothetical protein